MLQYVAIMFLLRSVSDRFEAPAVHGGLSLRVRCENALTGFLLQDLWALVACDKELLWKIPRGRLQTAAQTRRNLQGIALTVVSRL